MILLFPPFVAITPSDVPPPAALSSPSRAAASSAASSLHRYPCISAYPSPNLAARMCVCACVRACTCARSQLGAAVGRDALWGDGGRYAVCSSWKIVCASTLCRLLPHLFFFSPIFLGGGGDAPFFFRRIRLLSLFKGMKKKPISVYLPPLPASVSLHSPPR